MSLSIGRRATLADDIQSFKLELQEFYKEHKGQLHLLPYVEKDDHDAVRHMDEMFVDLELENSKKQKLKNYEELVKMENLADTGTKAKRVLILGDTGGGKTSLMSKIAYSWATSDHKTHLGLDRFELVFYLEMRKLTSCNQGQGKDGEEDKSGCSSLDDSADLASDEEDKSGCSLLDDSADLASDEEDKSGCSLLGGLEDLASGEEDKSGCSLLDEIFKQIPKSNVDQQVVADYISTNQRKVLILFDGWNECSSKVTDLEDSQHDIPRILIGEKYPQMYAIVSSCPYKTMGSDSGYVHVFMKGFPRERQDSYIRKFFHSQDDAAQSLIDELREAPILESIAKTPLMLMLICWMRNNQTQNSLPKHNRQTELYKEIFHAVWERYCTKEGQGQGHCEREEMTSIGHNALEEILLNEEFLKIRERTSPGKSLRNTKMNITFHPTDNVPDEEERKLSLPQSIREYCAMYYVKDKPEEIERLLNYLDCWDAVLNRYVMLQFACGLCGFEAEQPAGKKAAVGIVKHAIQKFKSHWDAKLTPTRSCAETDDYWIHLGSDEESNMYSEGDAICDILPVLSLAHESGVKGDEPGAETLIQEFRGLLLGLDKLTIFHCNQLPQILHFVKESGYGREALQKVKAISFKNQSSDSLGVVTDALSCTHIVQFVKIELKDEDNSTPHAVNSLALIMSTLSQLEKLLISGSFKGQRFQMSEILHYLASRASNPKLDKKQLKHAAFSDAEIGDEGIDNMEAIVTSQLEYLRLQNSALKEKHIEKLASFLTQAVNLTELHLVDNTVGESISPLIEHLNRCVKLQVLGLVSTRLQDEGVTKLAENFEKLPNLEWLELDDNKIGNSGLHNVFEHSKKLSKLTYLSISASLDTSCSKLVKKCLVELGEMIPEEGRELTCRIDIEKVKLIQRESKVPDLVKWFNNSKKWIDALKSI